MNQIGKSSGWSFIVRWDLKGNIMSLAFLRCWQALLCSVMLEITSTHRFLLCGFQKLHYSCLPLLNWGQIYVIVIRWAGSGQQTFFFRLSHGGPSDNWYLKTILDVGFSHIERKNFVTLLLPRTLCMATLFIPSILFYIIIN